MNEIEPLTIAGNPAAYRVGVDSEHWEPADGDVTAESLTHGPHTVAQLTIATGGHSAGVYPDGHYYGPGTVATSAELTLREIRALRDWAAELVANVEPDACAVCDVQRDAHDESSAMHAFARRAPRALVSALSGRPETFRSFDVAIAAELPDYHGSTEIEQARTPAAMLALVDEATGFLFTVYGRFPSGDVRAIADAPADESYEQARAFALQLAYSIADGRPVDDLTFNDPRETGGPA